MFKNKWSYISNPPTCLHGIVSGKFTSVLILVLGIYCVANYSVVFNRSVWFRISGVLLLIPLHAFMEYTATNLYSMLVLVLVILLFEIAGCVFKGILKNE
jgi:hypothetical protein